MKFPEKCPYCAKDINDKKRIKEIYEDTDDCGIVAELYRCYHCDKPIFAFREFQNTFNSTVDAEDILSYYPTNTFFEYYDSVKKLSPKAYKIYRDTLVAKNNNCSSLIGGGIRMALEQLVYDYLTQIRNIPHSELTKMQPGSRIKLMDADEHKKICIRFVHLYGNDAIHAIPKYDFTETEIETAISAYNDLCFLIDMEIRKNELLERLSNLQGNSNKSEK